MPSDFHHDFQTDVPPLPPDADEGLLTEVPQVIEIQADGREVLVVGDVVRCQDFCHQQGDNPLGFRGTCGLCSCSDVLNQFEVESTEGSIVEYAASHGLCSSDSPDPSMNGGTYPWQQAELLTAHGVPAHAEVGVDLQTLVDYVSEGRGVIVGVNAGILWDSSDFLDWGQANHAIVVTGTALDPATGEIVGFYVNDSGTGQAGRYVDAETMDAMWAQIGGSCVVTDVVK